MFWTEIIQQLQLFDEPEVIGSATVSQLIRLAEKMFPCECQEFHRRFALLTHRSTIEFLMPMLECKYGSVLNAKVPTLKWLEDIGSLETFARSTRSKCGNGRVARLTIREVPRWYNLYIATTHFDEVKQLAVQRWDMQMDEGVTCIFNSRHCFEELHHRDYGRLGSGDEHRWLVPLCSDCHTSMRIHGPAIPYSAPESVLQWL